MREKQNSEKVSKQKMFIPDFYSQRLEQRSQQETRNDD